MGMKKEEGWTCKVWKKVSQWLKVNVDTTQ